MWQEHRLTNKDISTRKESFEDWGIFGLGILSGATCIASTFNLKFGNASDELVRVRLVKIINHEIGHSLGLDDCPHSNCLREEVKGTIAAVDRETGALCTSCAKRYVQVVLRK